VIRRLVVLALLPVAVAHAKEAAAPGTPAWEESERVPAWVESPPAREGYVRFVDGGMSNLRDLAHSSIVSGRSGPVVLREFRSECARRLRDVLGREADRVVESLTQATLLRRASRSEVWDPGALGGSAVTVFGLWETPLAPLLDAVPAEKRDAARAALGKVEGEGVAWEVTVSPPAWVASPVLRKGFAHVMIADRADAADLARAQAAILGPDFLVERLIAALEPLLGSRKAAFEAVRGMESWRVLRGRTVRREGKYAIAWIAWDVPLDPVLERVPAEAREKARAALERVLRHD
jgi:hypothetical protein